MIFLAPAKVNLFLKITGKDKKDGYHYINSVFDPVSLYDIIDIEQRAGPAIQVKDAYGKLKIPAGQNLAYRAALILQKAARIRQGATIALYKYIPEGAGLGGGSSDAAAVLKALNTLWRVNMPVSKLKKLAAKLGSDVPFFISCRPSFVSGKGEKIRPLKKALKLWYVIVIKKGLKIATNNAYRWLDHDLRLTGDKKHNILINDNKRYIKIPGSSFQLHNDFEKVVCGRFKALAAVRELLIRCGRPLGVSLSGSGAAFFALFETKRGAVACYRTASRKLKGSLVFLAHSV